MDAIRPSRLASSLAVLIGILVLLAGCGGASSTAGPTATPTPTSTPDVPRPTVQAPASGAPIAVGDLCALVGEDAVAGALGGSFEAGGTETGMGSTSCTFTAASGDSVKLSITPGFSSLIGGSSRWRRSG